VLPHSGRPGRIYREVSALGATLNRLQTDLVSYESDSDVTLLYSGDTKRSYEFYPPLANTDGTPDRLSYLHIFDSFYRGTFDARAQVRILHMSQCESLDPATLASEHPVLVVPSLYVATDGQLDLLAEYARSGGRLVAGIRTCGARKYDSGW
jgi:beta-galactosidase